MSRPHFLRNAELLAAYNVTFNASLNRSLASVDGLPPALAEQLGHLLFMDRLWLARLCRETPDRGGCGSERAMQHAVRNRQGWYDERRALDAALTGFVHCLEEAELDAMIEFVTEAEQATVQCRTWAALTHLFNHQSLHRGEMLRLLASEGVVFGNSDLLPLIVDLVAHWQGPGDCDTA